MFKIKPVYPFNFDLSARIFSEGDPQIRKYENGIFWQVMRINNKLVLINLKSSEDLDKLELAVELRSNEKISDVDKQIA